MVRMRRRAGGVKQDGTVERTPGRSVDIKQTDSGFVVTVDGAHQQACADIAAVVAFVNTILPPTKRAVPAPVTQPVEGAAGSDDGV